MASLLIEVVRAQADSWAVTNADSPMDLEGRASAVGAALGKITEWGKLNGVTRVADATHLDRVGIANAYAVRPLAMDPCAIVSSGKGRSILSAKTGALFECFERWAAEPLQEHQLLATRLELSLSFPETRTLVPGCLSSKQVVSWTLGFSPLTKSEYFVPADCVFFPRNWAGSIQLADYRANTDGIASGTTPAEAMCAGIYELIERDAVTRMDINSAHRVNEDTLPEPLRELTDRFTSVGVDLSIIYCQSLANIPAFYVLSRDDITSESMFFCSGSGCHNRADTALLRALLEVSQSRVSFISGIRPDVGKRIARLRNNNYKVAADYFKPWFECPRTINFREITFSRTKAFNQMLNTAVCSLYERFGQDALVCSVLASAPNLYACRIFVPQLSSGDI